jgi:hypothetical protein
MDCAGRVKRRRCFRKRVAQVLRQSRLRYKAAGRFASGGIERPAHQRNFKFPASGNFQYNNQPIVNDPRINELRQLLPQAMLPDWVRLGSRAARLFRDRQHPDKHDATSQSAAGTSPRFRRRAEQRQAQCASGFLSAGFAITARKDEIVAAIRANQVVVIAGETGSGKTTQLPKMCLEAGLGIRAKIGCTQPRRVAALSISRASPRN